MQVKGAGLAAVVAIALLMAGQPVVAHHSFAAAYDAEKVVKFTGTVTKLEWTNPHTRVYVDVKDPSGKVENWGFEMLSPNILTRNGWTRTSLKAGDVITIEGARARNGSNNAAADTIVLASTGQRLFAGSNPAAQAQ